MDYKTKTIIIAGLVGGVGFGLGVLWPGKQGPAENISPGQEGYISKGYQAKPINTWYPGDRQNDCVKGSAPVVSIPGKDRRFIDKQPKEIIKLPGYYVASKGKHSGSEVLPIGSLVPKDTKPDRMLKISGCSGDFLSIKIEDINKNPFIYQIVLNKRGQLKLMQGLKKNAYQSRAVVRNIRQMIIGTDKRGQPNN